MRKIYLNAFILITIIFITACSSSDLTKEISLTTGINFLDGRILKNVDSHGGFHGDGTTYIEIMFSDKENESIIRSIENNDRWGKLPLTDDLNIALYGKGSSSQFIGPLVTNDEGKGFFPTVENGYYFFIDRYSESKDKKDDTSIINRNSFNFTIAIYDKDSKTLYYCELDT
ncbi:hypothetical protein [Senegalia massiliensis]|uniref:Lipoprotein n=1 Tax=Senegalia massiliensis TaxID=1720316 RepID=A0A845QZU7_9CLOT|nr:hypothetical protein [Senegalia massiliensis]NBI07841.1 hypothetical protein [Senegalia massiliensis]